MRAGGHAGTVNGAGATSAAFGKSPCSGRECLGGDIMGGSEAAVE